MSTTRISTHAPRRDNQTRQARKETTRLSGSVERLRLVSIESALVAKALKTWSNRLDRDARQQEATSATAAGGRRHEKIAAHAWEGKHRGLSTSERRADGVHRAEGQSRAAREDSTEQNRRARLRWTDDTMKEGSGVGFECHVVAVVKN